MAFYREIVNQPVIIKEEDEQLEVQRKARENLLESLIPFNFFADMFETAPRLVWALVVALVAFMSWAVYFMSFGTLVSAICLGFVLFTGVSRVCGWQVPCNDAEPETAEQSIQDLIRSRNEFRNVMRSRLLWLRPQETLEVVMMFVTTMLLFIFLDPTAILIVSILGLAFFDRWCLFGSGSLPEYLSRLIAW